ncbi:hypothetical protein [Vibrio sp. STUT-A11]|uniref:hypothetical protein n=1 Tax=Vibrio sp. STUT-A11 TaxID=2976236 RepID=UPI0022313C05|nr:hypothetical protein [Vibrio sp. STUT-A11]BDR15184.1 hypothetical protein VspSTUT11_31600 [Vibrio sp. STUT-A11]
MICNRRYALILVGLIGLPAFAAEPQAWSFNGTDYLVSDGDTEISVVVSREHALTTKQMKSLCRKGLGLSLRKQYEDKLVEGEWIDLRFDTWPFANLTYELTSIQFSSLEKDRASCSAVINDTGYKTNLQTTALNYAIAYYQTKQFAKIKPILPLLMKDSSVAMDAAGIVSLLLAQSDTEKADRYYQQYVDHSRITRNEVKNWLAQWKYDQGDLVESQLLAKSCTSQQCERLVMDIEETLFEQQAESAGDLSSYF